MDWGTVLVPRASDILQLQVSHWSKGNHWHAAARGTSGAPKLEESGKTMSSPRSVSENTCTTSLEPDVLGSQSEFKMLAGITVIDPRTSGELCIERAPSR